MENIDVKIMQKVKDALPCLSMAKKYEIFGFLKSVPEAFAAIAEASEKREDKHEEKQKH